VPYNALREALKPNKAKWTWPL